MTKTQVRKQLFILLGKLGEIRCELEDLATECEETSENIEPYEGYNDLTAEQEERRDWMDEQAYAIREIIDAIENFDAEVEC